MSNVPNRSFTKCYSQVSTWHLVTDSLVPVMALIVFLHSSLNISMTSRLDDNTDTDWSWCVCQTNAIFTSKYANMVHSFAALFLLLSPLRERLHISVLSIFYSIDHWSMSLISLSLSLSLLITGQIGGWWSSHSEQVVFCTCSACSLITYTFTRAQELCRTYSFICWLCLFFCKRWINLVSRFNSIVIAR